MTEAVKALPGTAADFPVAASVVAQWYLDEAQSMVREGRAACASVGSASRAGGEKKMKAAIFRGGDIVVDTIPEPNLGRTRRW